MKVQPSSARMLPEQIDLPAWRELLAQAAPSASQTLIAQQPQVLPRFAVCYTYLHQLPRRVRRGLQRRVRRVRRAHRLSVHGMRPPRMQSLASVALLLALGQAPASAATISVSGGCSLVDAITAANTNNAIGLCTAGSGADTIVLPANSTQTLTAVNNGYVGPSGLPVVTSAITIVGNGSTIARSSAAGTPDFRLLIIGAGGNVTLRRTTVSGGVLPGDSRGGGVYRRAGDLTLDGCTISGNTAYLGGGVASSSLPGTLTVTNSTILGNTATGNQGAGGVYNRGPLTVTNSTISGNKGKSAGGVRNIAVASITNSTISGNTADIGGGVTNLFRGSLTVNDSTISGNTARYDGGGIRNYQGTVTLTNSTVSNNSGSRRGGGLYNGFGRMTLTNSTVTGNTCAGVQCVGGGVFSGPRVDNLRSDVILFRTLISGNSASSGAEIFQAQGGVVTANSSNLFGHSNLTNAQAFSGFTPVGVDITATLDGTFPTPLTSILNPALGDNGGLTQTHALTPGSPAIDGAPTGCALQKTDQRGVPRPQDGNNDGLAQCDIGAFEVVRPGTVTCDGLPVTKVGTGAANTISGTSGVDVIQALGGNDTIKGLGGNDVLCGGPGTDQVLGGTGDDRLFGEADVDSVNGETGFDRCEASSIGDKASNCEQVRLRVDM